MGRIIGTKIKILSLFLAFTVILVLGMTQSASACDEASPCKPYLKVFGGDVFTGGWFASSSGTCNTAIGSFYQDDIYSSSGNKKYGGIMTFAKLRADNGPDVGSSSQFGALALGSVDGDSLSHGFYSNGSNAAAVNSPSTLTFANYSSIWGGDFQGSIRQAHCIVDYYSKLPSSAQNLSNPLTAQPVTGIYKATAPGPNNPFTLTNTPVSISSGRQVTVFVNGHVYIGNNITYGIGYNETNVPKFTLIVNGSIYISPNVNQLNGLYIAQPRACADCSPPTDDEGVIWTCHANSTSIDASYIFGNCNNKLIVNGALVAKQVHLTRIQGDLIEAKADEDDLDTALGSANIAEVINFSPAMVIGGGFLNPAANDLPLPLDSLISLPPVL